MLKGSFMQYPARMQLIIVLFFSLLGLLLFTGLGMLLLPVIFPISFSDLLNLSENISGFSSQQLLFLQGFTTLGSFLVPAMYCAHLFSFDGSSYLKLRSFPAPAWLMVLLLIVLTLSGNSIADLLYRLSKSIPWPAFMQSIEEGIRHAEIKSNGQIQSLLEMSNSFDFLNVFLVMAILPALCEEALFRGVIQPLMIKMARNRHIGIVLTAFVFAAIHLQFYSFLAIFALGIILGYVKEWSNSLWPSVLMHLVNNGSIVVGAYYFNMDYQDGTEAWDPIFGIGGLMVFSLTLLSIYKLLNR